MLEQAVDFREESEALYVLLAPLSEQEFERQTQFKDWTLNDILGHLHHWNWAADYSLRDGDAFQAWVNELMPEAAVHGLRPIENRWLDGLKGRQLLETWRDYYLEMSARFEAVDPKHRVKWAGPDMSVRSSITARLMETWSHAQAVYDLLGVERVDTDRIRNIAQLGINTFGWTFHNRGEAPPGDVPCVRLRAPSGASWEWNTENTNDRVEGSATEFCQVVTQTRNIADTGLTVSGPTATRWMAVAQCFAGPVETPPPAGARHLREV